MSQIGPDEAVSNLSKWWAWVASPPKWITLPVIDTLWTIGFLASAVAAFWLGMRTYLLWRRKVNAVKNDPEAQKPRLATENPSIKYAVNVTNSEHVSINIVEQAPAQASPQAMEAPKLVHETHRAWVKFVPGGLTVANSYNISSITDNGLGDYTINFSTDFDTDDVKASVLGTPPRNFRFEYVNSRGARVTFDEIEDVVVSLMFEEALGGN